MGNTGPDRRIAPQLSPSSCASHKRSPEHSTVRSGWSWVCIDRDHNPSAEAFRVCRHVGRQRSKPHRIWNVRSARRSACAEPFVDHVDVFDNLSLCNRIDVMGGRLERCFLHSIQTRAIWRLVNTWRRGTKLSSVSVGHLGVGGYSTVSRNRSTACSSWLSTGLAERKLCDR